MMQVTAIGIDKAPRRSIQAVILILACLLFLPVVGAASAADSPPAEVPAAKIQRFVDLLADPDVRDWITQHAAPGAKAVPVDASVAPAAAPPPSTEDDRTMPSTMSQEIGSLRERLVRLID